MELVIAFVGIIWLLLRLGNEKLSLASVRSDSRRANEYREYLRQFACTAEEYRDIVWMVKNKPLSEYLPEIEDDLIAIFGKDYYKERQDFTTSRFITNPVTRRWDREELFVIGSCVDRVAELILSKRGKIREDVITLWYEYWGKEIVREHMRMFFERIEHNLNAAGIDIEFVLVGKTTKNVLTDKFETRFESGCDLRPIKTCLSTTPTKRLW